MPARSAYRSKRHEASLNLISEETLRHLRRQLRHAHRLTYDEWRDFAMVWFQQPGARVAFLDLLDAAEAGQIAPRDWNGEDDVYYVKTLEFDIWEKCKKPCTFPGLPPSRVPGLVLRLKREVRTQVALLQDELRLAGKDLDVQGHRKAIKDESGTPFRRLAEDAFIDGLRPGQMVVVTGVPGSGKTQFALCHIAAPARKFGWAVVSNIPLLEPVEGYIYVSTYSEALIACFDAQLAGKRVIFLRDEGAQNRSRAASQTWEAKSQRSFSMLARHFGVAEVLVYQTEDDVPREVEDFATHLFIKDSQNNKGYVYCETLTGPGGSRERWTVDDLPSIEALREMGRPFLLYDHEKPAPLEVDTDFTPFLEVVFRRLSKEKDAGTLTHAEILVAMRHHLLMLHEAPKVDNPATLEQLYRFIATMHVDDPQLSPFYCWKIFAEDWSFNGFDKDKAMEMMRNWKMAAHPKIRGRRCGLCIKVLGAEEPEPDTYSTSNEPQKGRPKKAA